MQPGPIEAPRQYAYRKVRTRIADMGAPRIAAIGNYSDNILIARSSSISYHSIQYHT